MKEYELYIPIFYNDRRPVEAEKLASLQEILLAQFGGVTYLRSCDLPRHYIDVARARRFFELLKQQLKRELDQEEILIVERDVRTL